MDELHRIAAASSWTVGAEATAKREPKKESAKQEHLPTQKFAGSKQLFR